MQKIFTCFIYAVICAATLHAQPVKGFQGSFKIGYNTLPGSASTLNKIAPSGISGFSNHYSAFGAEGYFRTNKLMLGLDGNAGIQDTKFRDINHAQPFSSVGYVKAGYIVREAKRYWLFPTLGAGIAALGLTTYDQEKNEITNPANKILLNPSMDLGLNADFLLTKVQNQDTYGATLLGIRTGYRLSLKNHCWHDDAGGSTNQLPSYGYKGFYIMASIGFGIFIKN